MTIAYLFDILLIPLELMESFLNWNSILDQVFFSQMQLFIGLKQVSLEKTAMTEHFPCHFLYTVFLEVHSWDHYLQFPLKIHGLGYSSVLAFVSVF